MLPDDADASDDHEYLPTGRIEAFSDGVFSIAITLLVLDLAIGETGSPVHRVLDAWPFYLAYIVSFLTIGGAWLAHHALTNHLEKADAAFERINLLVLFFVSVLPFPTRLVASGIHHESDERVFVAMYGLTLLAIRLALFAVDDYARREHLYKAQFSAEQGDQRRMLLPVVAGYVVAIGIGIAFPVVAVILYCLVAVVLVVPFRELTRVFLRPRH
jgi:uncharacterized membrane protein